MAEDEDVRNLRAEAAEVRLRVRKGGDRFALIDEMMQDSGHHVQAIEDGQQAEGAVKNISAEQSAEFRDKFVPVIWHWR